MSEDGLRGAGCGFRHYHQVDCSTRFVSQDSRSPQPAAREVEPAPRRKSSTYTPTPIAVTHVRAHDRQPSPVRAIRAAGLALLLAGTALASACASIHRTIESYSTAPNGLAIPEDRLRRTLSLGRWDSAMVRAAEKDHGAPGDRLLRGMYAGLVAYYAGEYDRSAGAFERVWVMTDDRQTRKLSKEAASLVTNDRALPWMPSPSERLLARHYAMLGYLRHDDIRGAVVEARRLVLLLQELDDQGVPVEASTRAMLHYVAGAVFEAAGERNDADVAWRNAASLGLAVPERAGDAAHDDSATILVLVENGWVAHKVEQSLTLGFGTRDEIALFADEDGRKAHDAVIRREAEAQAKEEAKKKSESAQADSTLDAAKAKQKRQEREGITGVGSVLSGMAGSGGGRVSGGTRQPDRAPQGDEPVVAPRSLPIPPPVRDPEAMDRRERERTKTVTVGTNVSPIERLFGILAEDERDEWYTDQWDRPRFVRSTRNAGYVLTIAWPTFARPEPAPRAMAVSAWDGDSLVASDIPMHVASLSDAVVSDFRRQRAAIFSRAVARAATKYWLSEQAEKKKKWAGLLVNAAGDLLEHADTRSWHLLPGEVSLIRLRVPAGTHTLAADLSDPRRGRPAHLELGQVTVRAGETRIVTARAWGSAFPRPPLPVAPRTAAN